ADIIVKGGRQVQYGHKLNLATGRSGLILDVVIETGNPADAERFLPMLDRHIARSDAPPHQTAADGAYASRANLVAAKARGHCRLRRRGSGCDAVACTRNLPEIAGSCFDKVIHDDDVAGAQAQHQKLLDIGAKAGAVDRTVDDAGGSDAVA